LQGDCRISTAVPHLPLRRVVSTAVLLLSLGAAPAAFAAPPSVHIRGMAYEFNNVGTLLGGATVHVLEQPMRLATVRPDGSYDLVVPDHARITPHIVAAGHHTIFLQTFTTAGADLANVNFQTPSDAVYRALAQLLKVPVDPAGEPVDCAIVSTCSTRNVRGLDFRGFVASGAPGVAGPPARAPPALPPPIYFNEHVIPDPTQKASSVDGGVIWTGVPAGRYRITAHHPRTRFAPFVATCAPGRIVNANPPWGLHELGLRNPTRLHARWTRSGGRTTLRSLTATRMPAASVVSVACSGARCPLKLRRTRVSPSGGRADVLKALGARALRFRAGQVVQVTASAPAHDGVVLRFHIRSGTAPRVERLCLPLGDTAPRSRC
jgi:hypothetical protein